MSSSSIPKTVLISGVNGYLATDVALAFLNAGYRVRGTVRSQAKADAWLALPSFAPFASSGQLECTLVQDITAEESFAGAPLEGVDYFIHTIAQLPDWRPGVKQDYEKDILLPNINGTLAALRSAAKYPQCKKVIVLGSISGAVDFSVPKHDAPITGESWNPRDFDYGKTAPHPLLAYTTSKKLADEAAWKWMKDVKPHFALINMLPGFIYGPAHGHDPFGVNNSSQQWLAGPLFRKDWDFKIASGGPTMVDLRDLCEAHIRAVERDEANGHRFVLGPSHVSIFPSDFVPLFAKAFPERAASLPEVPSDLVNAPLFTIDSSVTEEKLGMKFRSVEETVLDTAKWLIASGGEEAWAAVGKRY